MLFRSRDSQTDPITCRRLWCERGLAVIVDGPDGHVERVIEKPFARIGSHKDSEVVLPRWQVAKRSLYLHATDAGVYCIDLRFRDEGKERSRGWLAPDEVILLGPYRLCVRLDRGDGPVDKDRTDLEGRAGCEPPNPVFSVSVGGQPLGNTRLTRPLTVVGRKWPSRIRLSSRSVSRCHCAMYWDSGTLWVIDLLSEGGTWLEGRSIEVATLLPGQALAVGRAELTYATEWIEHQREPPPDGSGLLTPPGSLEADRPQAAVGLALEGEDIEQTQAGWQEEPVPLEGDLAGRSEGLARQRTELDAKRVELDAAVADLGRREAELIARHEAWQSQVQAKEEELAQRAGQLEADLGGREAELTARQDAWQSQVQAKEEELAQRTGQLEADLGKREAELIARQEAWQSQVQAKEEELAQRAGQLEADLSGREAELIARHEAWQSQVQAKEEELAQRAGQLEKEREETAARREALERDQALWRAERERLDKQSEAVLLARQRELAETEAQRAKRLEEQSAAAASQEESLQRRLEEVQSREERLRSDQGEFESRRRAEEDRLADRAASLGQEALRLASEREDFEQAVAAWQRQRQGTERDLAERREKLDRRLADLETARHELDAERTAHHRQRAVFEARREAAAAELQRELSERREVQEKLADRLEEVARRNADLESRQRELDARALEHERRWEEFQRERSAAEARLEEQLASLAKLRAETEPARTDNADSGESSREEAGRAVLAPGVEDDDEHAEEVFERAAARLMSHRQSGTRWHGIKRAVLRCVPWSHPPTDF